MNPLVLLLLGGGALLAMQMLGKPAAGSTSGAGPNVSTDPAALKAQFDALVETLPGGKSANPDYEDFFQRTLPTDVFTALKAAPMSSYTRDNWDDGEASKEAGATFAVLALTPTAEPKDSDAKLRGDLMQMGSLLWQHGIDAGKYVGVIDRTRFSPEEALAENKSWFSNYQALMKASKNTTTMDASKRKNNAHLSTKMWFIANPKELLVLASAMAMSAILVDKSSPAKEAMKNLQGLYRTRAARLGASSADLDEYDKAATGDPVGMIEYMNKRVNDLPENSAIRDFEGME
jgi:hypothetical protein